MPHFAERQRGFSTALLDAGQEMPAGLIGPDGKSSLRRYGVYRNNAVVGLCEALRANFPVVERLVGPEFFTAMARVFVALAPPQSPILLDYGADFADFLDHFEPAQILTYLPDIARLERAVSEAYHACEAEPLSVAAFASIAPQAAGDLRLAPHPSARLLRSAFPVATIWWLNSGCAEPVPVDLSCAEDVLVLRAEVDVTLQTIPPGGFEFLQELHAGHSIAEALRAALFAAPDFEMAAYLRELIKMGAFSAAHLPSSTFNIEDRTHVP